MGRFWDERAREDAMFFVDDREPYGNADAERFWAQANATSITSFPRWGRASRRATASSTWAAASAG